MPILQPKRKRQKSARRDLLVLTWDKVTGHLRHVSKCSTERGALMSQRYTEKLWSRIPGRVEVQIADAEAIRALGCATTRATEIAELEALLRHSETK